MEEAWKRGDVVDLHRLDFGQLVDAGAIVVEEGSYYHQPCRAAGRCQGVTFDGNRSYLRLLMTGTLCEALLKAQTGRPNGEVREGTCASPIAIRKRWPRT